MRLGLILSAMALAFAPSAAAQTIPATCASLPGLLASAKGGETFNLKGNCGPIKIARVMPKRVTINAGGATVRGLVIMGGGNIRWRSGTLAAPKGKDGFAGDGYAVLIRNARDVRFDGVLVTDAKKGVVTDNADRVTIADSRFLRYGEDGVIANRTRGLTIVRNRFADIIGRPTQCATAGGVLPALSRAVCEARGGTWADGYHPDAVQMRNATTDVLLEGNVVEGKTQGMTEMASVGDAPLARVTIRGNSITAEAHHITLYSCAGCLIERNKVRRYAGAAQWKAVIRPGVARRCGNDVQDEKADGGC